MIEDIKISVIVPSYNQGTYIENCIKSVQQQNYSNWELIIQDGNSNDITRNICEKYAEADKRIIFKTEKDKGFADAVNKALVKATGTIGIIQSSDDFFAYNNVFKDVIQMFKNDENLQIIAGAAIVVNDSLELLATQERIEKYVPIENIFTLKDHFSQGATFFTLEKAKKINYLNPAVDMVADTDFWVRMSCSNPIKLNSIYQTSKIWGAVTVQPNQRSSDLSKFYYGRAFMAKSHLDNENISLSNTFKLKQINDLIKIGISHFQLYDMDIEPFLKLYKEVNQIEYLFENKPISIKTMVRSILSSVKHPNKLIEKSKTNSKSEYFLFTNSPKISFRWFN